MSAVALTLGWIAGAAAGSLRGRSETLVRDVVTDSRSMTTGDVVLIAGKGHEKYQVIGGTTFPFDDVAVARDALGTRRQTSGVG